MTPRGFCAVFLAAAPALLLTGAPAGSALARQAMGKPQNVAISMALPAPGTIAVRLFELKFTLKPGAVAPDTLVVKPLDRSRLPKGVAVVAAARLMKNSLLGGATYAGMVAAFRPKSTSKTVRHVASARTTQGNGAEFDVAAILLQSGLVGLTYDDDGHVVEPAFLTPRAPMQDLANEFDNITHSSSTAFSWSADKAPASSTAAGTVADDVAHSIYQSLTPELLDEIETNLNAQFDNDFPEGSLDSGSSSSKSVGGTTTSPTTSTAATSATQSAGSSLVKDVSLSISLNGFTGATVTVMAAANTPRSQTVVLEFSGPGVPSGKTVSVAPGRSDPVTLSVPSTACGTWKAQIVSDNGLAVHAGNNPALEVGWSHAC